MNTMLKISCAITGDDYQIVKKETLPSRKKINLLAMAINIPVVMWFASAYLLTTHILGKPFINALLAAFFVSFIVFLIERAIVMAQGSKLIFGFRVLLGLFIAVLGSVALDEVIFQNDIDNQVFQIKSSIIEIENQKLEKEFVVDHMQLKDEVEEKGILWKNALMEAQKEADGTGGSGQRGVSKITKLKIANASLLEQDYLESKNKLNLLNSKIENTKEDRIKRAEDNFNTNSLLLRIKAMFQLISTNKYMMTIYFVLTAILFLLEFSVVLLKNGLKETTYEKKLKAVEKIAADRIDTICKFERQAFHPEKSTNAAREATNILNSTSVGVF